MSKRQVIIELQHNKDLAAMAFAVGVAAPAELDISAVPRLVGLKYDTGFVPTSLPGLVPRTHSGDPYDMAALFDLAMEPESSTYIVRGEVDEEAVEDVRKHKAVLGVYSDPVIEPTIVCPGSPPVGTDADVERLLCVSTMKACKMDGLGVLVAIVDTGINIAYLNAHGKTPHFDTVRSWVPRPGLTPGAFAVNHGTMCAYDVCIAAPNCTILDIAVLASTAAGPTIMSGVLSDAVRAYNFLVTVMTAPRRPGEAHSMVVNNSWGMFNPSWDFPVGNPGNYSDNPNHPFNRIVATLERAGADILFAAGNCGPDCPDGRCGGVTANAIYGANGHPSVLCVAGVDTTKARVGYSTVGPGRLTKLKPDLCGYTHFRGSGVYSADGGTSAATPVVSGVVAAVRSKRPFDPATPTTSPAAIRMLLTTTAEDLGPMGYDFQYGYGVVSGCALAKKLCPIIIDICKRYPWLCREPWDICQRYPWLCQPGPKPPIPPIPPPQVPGASETETAEAIGVVTEPGEEGAIFKGQGLDLIESSFIAGYYHGQQAAEQARAKKSGCGCNQ
jgi:hypothetical protein